jgi:hypothetical protein
MCLGLTSLTANADIITFNVSGIVTPSKGVAACSPTCTVGGSFTLDNSTGAVSLASFTVAVESPAVTTFNFFAGTGSGAGVVGANSSMTFFDAGFVDTLKFYFPTPNDASLIGYTGGPIVNILLTNVPNDPRADWNGTGSITNSAVPEPSSLMLLGSGLAGLTGLVRRKLRK